MTQTLMLIHAVQLIALYNWALVPKAYCVGVGAGLSRMALGALTQALNQIQSSDHGGMMYDSFLQVPNPTNQPGELPKIVLCWSLVDFHFSHNGTALVEARKCNSGR